MERRRYSPVEVERRQQSILYSLGNAIGADVTITRAAAREFISPSAKTVYAWDSTRPETYDAIRRQATMMIQSSALKGKVTDVGDMSVILREIAVGEVSEDFIDRRVKLNLEGWFGRGSEEARRRLAVFDESLKKTLDAKE